MDEEAKPRSNADGNTDAASSAAEAAASTAAPSSSESAEGKAKAKEEEEEEEAGDLVGQLVELVEEIAAISDFRNAYRRQFCNLSRRIRLLAPMLEEAKEGPRPLPEVSYSALRRLREALGDSRELLRLGSSGSKIFLVLEREKVMKSFQDITARLEQALGSISFDELEISDEVREQVELVHAQFKRAKERSDPSDDDLFNDLVSIYNSSTTANVDPDTLQRLSEKLQLVTISDLNQESLILHEMAAGGDPGGVVEKMSMLLKRIKDFVQSRDPETGNSTSTTELSGKDNIASPIVPDDFRCPISLDLMKDPVIVATGQTYERGYIERWLEAGHDTCPKTQLKLPNKSLTPNYVLRSLIAQWCEANGMEPPKRAAQHNNAPASCTAAEHSKVVELLQKLSSQNLEDQREAAGMLRQLAKRSPENRACIGDAGAIPILVSLLSTTDVSTQEHVVTALLNLSIYEENKARIITSGAVPGVVHVLKRGSMEARENSAATLFSLSLVDENKITIGASGAIPALVLLLSNGSQRGKRDAATALFNLCIYQGNKGKAVRAGLVPILLGLVTETESGMMDEALAILAILSSHPEGKTAISSANAISMLVGVIRNGSARNKENAAAVLVHLCNGEQQQQHLAEAQEQGIVTLLEELAESGTDRGKRKAIQLLERMNRFLMQQSQAQAQAEAMAQAHAYAQSQAQALNEAQSQADMQVEQLLLPTSSHLSDRRDD
ncbi:protein spotted leaf 11-like isoform X2 [Oryza brachyantha]|uniref:U-box domain-containing protein 12 n=1 Tax=Oryza brachyantha TaxID=4533 RepID=J3LMG7_ORYBR|nr:protein spotted leaf 11-like isoform X2 [Oryza brachyantha]